MQLSLPPTLMPLKQFLPLLLLTAIPAMAMPAMADVSSSTTIAQSDSSQSMSTTAEKFINLAVKGDFDSAWQYLHPSLRETWSPEDMRNGWDSLQQQNGAFKQILSSRQAGDDVVLVNAEFENVTDDLVVIFDENHQWIVGVDFPEQR